MPHLPELSTDLVTALASLDVDNLAHVCSLKCLGCCEERANLRSRLSDLTHKLIFWGFASEFDPTSNLPPHISSFPCVPPLPLRDVRPSP